MRPGWSKAVWFALMASVAAGGLVRSSVASAQARNDVSAVRASLPKRWLPVDEQGWTVFKPSPDTRIVYVSSTQGDDATGKFYAPTAPEVGPDPFNPVGPVEAYGTLAAAMAHSRKGFPDWVLLRRGDVWHEALLGVHSGRSRTEPFLVSTYGSEPARPQLRPGKNRFGVGFDTRNGLHDAAVVGLELYASPKDPASEEFDPARKITGGIGFLVWDGKAGERVLIEDCCMRFCGAVFQALRGGVIRELVFRRNLVLDNYSRWGHCSGMFAHHVSMLLQENVYDHDAWLVRERGNRTERGGATMFNHDTYFSTCHDVVFRGNMFLRAASSGNKWTANEGPGSSYNLVMDNDLYVEGEIGIGIGGNKVGPLRFKNVQITNNVLMHIGRAQPTYCVLAWYIDLVDWDGGLVAGNLLIQQQEKQLTNT